MLTLFRRSSAPLAIATHLACSLSLVPLPIRGIDREVATQFKSRRAWFLRCERCCFGRHFGAWVASLDETTLTHSLLFVTAHPLVIVVGMMLLAPSIAAMRPPMAKEALGAVVCFVGAGITLLDTGSSQGIEAATVYGDALAFGGAVFVVGYIVVASCGHGCPFPLRLSVWLIAAVLLLPCSMVFEPNFSEFGATGWTDGEFFWFLCWR